MIEKTVALLLSGHHLTEGDEVSMKEGRAIGQVTRMRPGYFS